MEVALTLVWLTVAAAQLVAAVAVRRPLPAVGFAAAAGLLATGAVVGADWLLVAGCVSALLTPLAVGLTSRERPSWSHHATRAALLIGLLAVTAWA